MNGNLNINPTIKETEDTTSLDLNKTDVGLILNKEGDLQIYLPKGDDSEEVPIHVHFITAIAVLLKIDPDFIDYVWGKYNEKIKDIIGVSNNKETN